MTTAAEVKNQVQISDAGPCRKKVKITVPAEKVAENVGMLLDTMTVEAELPGFRKGHAPRRLVEKKFGSLAKGQAKEQLVGQAFQKAVEENKLRVIGQPTSEQLGKVEVELGKPLSFEIDVEVMPEFQVPALEGIAVTKPTMDVTEEMVTKELEKLCLQEGSLEERETPEPGDYVTGMAKLYGATSKKVYFESDGIVVQCPTPDKNGKGMIVGLVVDDLAKQFGLPKPGQQVTVKTTGPENHENEELRGQPLVIDYTPSRVDRIIPAKAEDLAGRYGYDSAAAVSDAIRTRLQQRVAIEQQVLMRQQVAKHLIEKTEMTLPERITAQQAQRNLERHRYELMYRGVDAMKIEERIAGLRSISAAEAVRDLKLFFVVNEVAEKLNVKVSDNEVNGRIAQIAVERGMRPDKLRQEMINNGQAGTVFQQIREHKTLDAVVAKASISEMPVEEFNKKMAAENAKK
jgi:trigger factor